MVLGELYIRIGAFLAQNPEHWDSSIKVDLSPVYMGYRTPIIQNSAGYIYIGTEEEN